MSLRNRAHSPLNLLLEAVLVSAGVFLALWANSWHEKREHRTLAEAAIRNFAAEMRTNQQAVRETRQYHESLAREVHQFVGQNELLTQEQFEKTVHFRGVHQITFEHTAWDLALATQSLSYIKPDLAFSISKVYTQQNAFQTLENGFLSSIYTPATFSSDDVKGLATALDVYLTDVNIQEPLLLKRYDKVIPEIERALPHSSGR